MLMRTFLAVFLLAALSSLQGQSLAGTWTLESTEFQAVTSSQNHGLTPQTCLWRDLATEHATLTLMQDGTARFPIDGQHSSKRYRVEEDQLVLSIESPMGQTSQVRYSWERQGSRLVLQRSDKLVSERYVFRGR
jgi:hypothetical protein